MGIQQHKYLFNSVRQEVQKDEDAILGYVSSIVSSMIAAPMRQFENFCLGTMRESAHARERGRER